MQRILGRLARGRVDPPSGADDPRDDVELLLERYGARRYVADPVRPWMLVASRVALWGAVALGAGGGLVGCLRGDEAPAPVMSTESDPAVVPAQVASMAEIVVGEWLLATDEEEDRIARLFVEPPRLPLELTGREVQEVRTVSGLRVQTGYWSITLAAEVLHFPDEVVEGEDTGTSTGGGSGEDEEIVPELATWYVEVGIVGDPETGLAALRTPAIVPAPREVDEGWAYTSSPWQPVVEGDELAQTVDGFLDAVLTGEGNPGPYLAPGVDVSPLDPPPLQEVAVDEVSLAELEDGRLRVQVRVQGETAVGDEQPLVYELDMRWRDDRYEVLAIWGTSTLTGQPTDDARGGQPGAETALGTGPGR